MQERDSDAPVNEASLPDDEPEEELCPNMDAFILAERLPDFLDVFYDDSSFEAMTTTFRNEKCWEQFTRYRYPVKFVRVYPPRNPTDKRDASVNPPSGWLNLPSSERLGSGSHSEVILTPLVLPSTVTAPSAVGRVAVKFARTDRDMLWNEARIYNAFPRELQEASPNGPPVVPKFYGFYIPSVAFDYPKVPAEDRTTVRKMIKSISPILLLEQCGKPIKGSDVDYADMKKQLASLLNRLHKADFVQGSFYDRNILVQPGPLTLPHAKRSLHEPSFRLIDFGRGMSPRVNCVLEPFLQERSHERTKFRRRWTISKNIP